jgi:hypothetical protein
MKRSCDGCRALWYHYTFDRYCSCILGYKVKSIFHHTILVGAIPLEECPKPMTYKKYFNCEPRSSREV